MTVWTIPKDMNTDQHEFDNQVVLICNIQTIIFCSIITHIQHLPHKTNRSIYLQNYIWTLCSEKNTPSCFLLYLYGKCLDIHKVSRECLGGSKYSNNGKDKYSLLPVTSCWHHISVFANYGFYHWRQTYDKMLKHTNWWSCRPNPKIH